MLTYVLKHINIYLSMCYSMNVCETSCVCYTINMDDFVYNPLFELQSIELALVQTAKQYQRDNPQMPRTETGDDLTIPAIHLMYSRVRTRLELCVMAIQLYPQAMDQLEKLAGGPKPAEIFRSTNETSEMVMRTY